MYTSILKPILIGLFEIGKKQLALMPAAHMVLRFVFEKLYTTVITKIEIHEISSQVVGGVATS